MNWLIIYLYRSLWLSLSIWIACICLGCLGGYLLANHFNDEKADQLNRTQIIQDGGITIEMPEPHLHLKTPDIK